MYDQFVISLTISPPPYGAHASLLVGGSRRAGGDKAWAHVSLLVGGSRRAGGDKVWAHVSLLVGGSRRAGGDMCGSVLNVR